MFFDYCLVLGLNSFNKIVYYSLDAKVYFDVFLEGKFEQAGQ